MKLTTKQESFAQHYALHGDAVGAYKAAGYSWKRMKNSGLRANAHKMLRVTNVSLRIKELQDRKKERAEHIFDITADKILQELAAIGFANMEDYMSVDDDGTPRVSMCDVKRYQWAAVSEITTEDQTFGSGDNERTTTRTKIKLLDKKGALVELGKHVGLFKEQHKHEHNHKHEIVADAADQLDAGLDLFIARAGEEASATEAEGGDRVLN